MLGKIFKVIDLSVISMCEDPTLAVLTQWQSLQLWSVVCWKRCVSV